MLIMKYFPLTSVRRTPMPAAAPTRRPVYRFSCSLTSLSSLISSWRNSSRLSLLTTSEVWPAGIVFVTFHCLCLHVESSCNKTCSGGQRHLVRGMCSLLWLSSFLTFWATGTQMWEHGLLRNAHRLFEDFCRNWWYTFTVIGFWCCGAFETWFTWDPSNLFAR